MVYLKTISDLITYKVEILTSSQIKILPKNHTLRAAQIQISFIWEYPPSRRKDLHRLLYVFMSVQHFCATKNFLHVMSIMLCQLACYLPSSLLHLRKASSLDSFSGKGFSLKYISVELRYFVNWFTAISSVSCLVIFLAISTACR